MHRLAYIQLQNFRITATKWLISFSSEDVIVFALNNIFNMRDAINSFAIDKLSTSIHMLYMQQRTL